MTTLQLIASELNRAPRAAEDYLDIDTIRRRVAKIKNTWSEATATSRAIEGLRRRAELAAMMEDLLDDDLTGDDLSGDDRESTFSLVG